MLFDSGLPREPKRDCVATDAHVGSLQGEKPMGPVAPLVFLRADAQRAAVKEPDGPGEDARLLEAASAKVGGHLSAEVREMCSEGLQPPELCAVAPLAPHVVIAVLPPTGRIGPCRLKVPVGVGTDPHVLPRGWDRKGADPRERRLVIEAGARWIEVREPAPVTPPSDTCSVGI